MKKICVLLSLLLITLGTAWAEPEPNPDGKRFPQAVTKAQSTVVRTMGTRAGALTAGVGTGVGPAANAVQSAMPSYRGIHNEELLNVDLGVPAVPVAETQVPRVNNRKDRPFLQQLTRDVKAARLKRQHAKTVEFKHAKDRLPKLKPDESKVFFSLEALEVRSEVAPALPWMKEPGVLYRGMSLSTDGIAIRKILEHGLLIEDVGPDNNHLFVTYSGAGAPGSVATSPSLRFTNLSNAPATACHYATINNTKGSLSVLVRVTGLKQDKDVVRVKEDISPDHIEEMIAFVNFNGVPSWCRVELQNGLFLLTPYEVK